MVGIFALYVIYTVLDPLAEHPWMQVSVLTAILSISLAFGTTLEKYRLNVSMIFLVSLFNFWAYYKEFPSLLQSGSFLARGSISSFMVLSTGLFIVVGWRKMLKNAAENDLQVREMLAKLERLRESQEVQKMWRELVVRIHETTLNTLRSIIAMPNVSMSEIKNEIEDSVRKNRRLISHAEERRAGSVISAIRAGIDSAQLKEKIRISSKGINLHLETEVFEVIERLIRETLRNAVMHGKAKHLEINWETKSNPQLAIGSREEGTLSLEISDDGKQWEESAQRGIGTQLVMMKSVENLGGTLDFYMDSERGQVVRAIVPTIPDKSNEEEAVSPTNAVNLGRYMALLTLFGPAMTGLVFFPLLNLWWPGQYLSQLIGLVAQSLLLYLTFMKARRLGWIASVTLALLLLATVYFIDVGPLTCVTAQPVQWLFNITVYGLFIIMLGGKWQVTAFSYPIFLLLAAKFSPLVPNACNYIFAFPLINTLLSCFFVLLVFYVVYKTIEKVENYQEKKIGETSELIETLESRERFYRRILQLDESAQELLLTISKKNGVLDEKEIISLRKIDAELRAELQIEPTASSGLTILASEFIAKAISCNRWLEVKSIHGDEEPIPIPEVIREKFLAFASDVPSGSTIHVVVRPDTVALSLACSGKPPESLLSLQQSASGFKTSDMDISITQQRFDIDSKNQYVLTISRGKAVKKESNT